jgi:hypothetical protein
LAARAEPTGSEDNNCNSTASDKTINFIILFVRLSIYLIERFTLLASIVQQQFRDRKGLFTRLNKYAIWTKINEKKKQKKLSIFMSFIY